MEEHEKQFTHGFNNGYLLAKHEPELYSTIAKGLEAKNEYLDGLLSGGKEFVHEINAPIKSLSKEEKERDIEKDI